MLPNLIVIGAAKSGTTSLHLYLSMHPQISMSKLKELNFFIRDDWADRLPWYSAQFESKQVRGESSPTYTQYPYCGSAAEAMFQAIPDAKLIYMVRDPVERAVASYAEEVHNRREVRNIEAAFADLEEQTNPYVMGSRYTLQLNRFLEYFPINQVLIIDSDELRSNRRITLMEVFQFLGVDDTFTTPEFEREHNTESIKVKYNSLGFWLVRQGIFTQRGGPFKRGPLIKPLRRLLGAPIDRELPRALRNRLHSILRPEAEGLQALAGKAFADWPTLQ